MIILDVILSELLDRIWFIFRRKCIRMKKVRGNRVKCSEWSEHFPKYNRSTEYANA